MNYIYDIYLNFNDVLYDFFDWDKNDLLMHIKKIPIFKINSEDLIQIINNTIEINKDFLSSIYRKTELWNTAERNDFYTLFCDDNNIIAIEFNEYGKSIKKSYLQIDEELEILETVYKFKEFKVEYKILKKEKILLKTRKELKDEIFVEKELKNIENDKLKYIYFECFGKHEKNEKEILSSINKISKNSKTYKNLYNILKLTSTTKNKML